jgi:hypothetical protein
MKPAATKSIMLRTQFSRVVITYLKQGKDRGYGWCAFFLDNGNISGVCEERMCQVFTKFAAK